MFVHVRQRFPHRKLEDISGAVRREICGEFSGRISQGARVAIGAGSRGIANIGEIVGAAVEAWKALGVRPFVFPAMGSHGAATAEGQASVLAHYGIDEQTMGCPIVSSFNVVPLGATELGVEAFAARDAWESDGIFLVNRVKWHTGFAGEIESGVTKMMAIGLGKIDGARTCHAHARKLGMEKVIRSVGAHMLASGKILGGLAVLEDAFHDTAEVHALSAEGLIEREKELLARTKSWMGRIPVPELDVLIIDEIGKNISGTGMDTKVVNRGVLGQYNPWPDTTRVERIFIRDLSPLSYGNGLGIGLADVIHSRLLRKIDVNPGRINARTSGSLASVRTPLHFDSDRECIELAAGTVGKFRPEEVTMAWIRNTLELSDIAMTANLADSLAGNPNMEIVGAPFDLEFDAEGNLSNRFW